MNRTRLACIGVLGALMVCGLLLANMGSLWSAVCCGLMFFPVAILLADLW